MAKDRELNNWYFISGIIFSIVYPLYSTSIYPEKWLVVPIAYTIVAFLSLKTGFPKWCLKK